MHRPHDREGDHPGERPDRHHAAPLHSPVARRVPPLQTHRGPGSRHGQSRRWLPLPRHRAHPRRARLPQHERRDPGQAGAPHAGQAEAVLQRPRPVYFRISGRCRSGGGLLRHHLARRPARHPNGPRAGRPRRHFPHHLGMAVPGAAHSRSRRPRQSLRRSGAEPGPDGPRGGAPHGGPRQSHSRIACGRHRTQTRSHPESHSGGRPMSEAIIDCVLDSAMTATNPVEPFLRMDRMPHIWCPACGIGTTVNCFARARESSKLNLDKVAIVSGIGCTGRVAGYANLDSFHTTHGRAIPFATGLKLSNPELQVVVYSGDGDLFAIGGNHWIGPASPNMDIKVICVNNLTYAMTGGQTAPTTPSHVISATAPYGVFEPAFNLVQLADACGASYVARWTTFHVKQLARSMEEVLKKKGFGFIEIVSPCPTLYQRRNKMGDGLDTMKFYKQMSKTRNGAPTSECALTKAGEIVVGKFVDRDRPGYFEMMSSQMHETLGDRYAEPEAMCSEC